MKNRPDPFCALTILASLAAKLIFSFRVYGTNDVTYWIHFAKLVRKYGAFDIYSLERIYNHPPLISWILKLMPWLMSVTHLGFPFLFRLMPILADCGSLWLIWKLLERRQVKHRRLILAFCAFNPLNFLISAFHGNTDPVFIFLLLLVVYFYETEKPLAAGLAYGLSLCIKIVPVLAAPFLIFHMKTTRERLIFVAGSAAVAAVVYAPYLSHDFHAMSANVFGYSSLRGIWGWGHVFQSAFQGGDLPLAARRVALELYRGHVAYGMGIYFTLLLTSFYFLKARAWSAVEGIFFTFCLFLAVTPGFGVQYLSWLSFFAMIVLPAAGTVYSLIGGVFLYRVYTFWSGGFPMNDANSDLVGPWIGFEKTLELLTWAAVLLLLALFLIKKNRILKTGVVSR